MGGVLAYAAADARADTAAVREKAANEATEQKQKQKQFVELQQQQDRQKAVLESQEISVGMHSSGWSREAMRLLENANAIRPGDDLRDLAAATLIGLDAAPIYEHEFPYPPKPGQMGVGRVVFSPDGVRVLAAGWRNRNRNDLSPALLWDGNIANKSTPSARPGEGPVAFPDANSPLQLILPGDSRQPMTLWHSCNISRPSRIYKTCISCGGRFRVTPTTT